MFENILKAWLKICEYSRNNQQKLSWKYVNTAEIISKITMTLPLINSNNDFDFVGWVIKTPCLFYFRSVKFHDVKETHMMIAAFWRWWKLLQHLSTKDNERNLCQDLLTGENTDSDLKMHALHYANKLLNARVRLSFQKLLQTCQTNRNNKKLSKQGLVVIKHCLGNLTN